MPKITNYNELTKMYVNIIKSFQNDDSIKQEDLKDTIIDLIEEDNIEEYISNDWLDQINKECDAKDFQQKRYQKEQAIDYIKEEVIQNVLKKFNVLDLDNSKETDMEM